MDRLIVYLCRKLGWTFDYACEFVRFTSVRKLNAFVEELTRQEAEDDYKNSQNFAMLIANWATAQGKRKYRTTDFIGQPPVRVKDNLREAAEAKGITMPEEDL